MADAADRFGNPLLERIAVMTRNRGRPGRAGNRAADHGSLSRGERRTSTGRIWLLGDRVLQGTAWRIAERLGGPDTLDAGTRHSVNDTGARLQITSDRDLGSRICRSARAAGTEPRRTLG